MLRYPTLVLLSVLSLLAANVTVNSGSDLQAALNQAKGGDTITLQAGATFTGNFTVAKNQTGQTITIQSSQRSALPKAGSRVSSSQANLMPKIVSPNAGAALLFPSGASDYHLIGIEITTTARQYVNDLIEAGDPHEKVIANEPNNLDFDRVYVHAQLPTGSKRGLALNCRTAKVHDSYFENFVSDWQDTQAIAGWNGPGPFLIQNNYLQSGSEIVAFGGAPTAAPNVIPGMSKWPGSAYGIIIQNNDFFKPVCWWERNPCHTGPHIRAKNHIEFKNGENSLIQNNTFTNNMVGADQAGFTILLNVRTENGAVPWATVSNITVQNNVLHHIAGGFLLMGRDVTGNNGGTAHDITIQNNVLFDMGVMGGVGSALQIMSHVDRLTVDHNTVLTGPGGWALVFANQPNAQFRLTNNIWGAGTSLAGDCSSDPRHPNCGRGQATLNYFAPGAVVQHNIFLGANPNDFTGPAFVNNQLLPSAANVGFVNTAAGHYSLTKSSSYAGYGATGALAPAENVSGQAPE